MTTYRRSRRPAVRLLPVAWRSISGNRRGVALAVALVTLLVVSLVAAAVLQSLVAEHRQSRQQVWALQAEWLAEAGLARGERQLARDAAYDGETWVAAVVDAADNAGSIDDSTGQPAVAATDPFASGRVTIRVAAGSPRKLIVEAVYPDVEHQRVKVRRERALEKAAETQEDLP